MSRLPPLSKKMVYAAQDEFHILPPRMKRLWARMESLVMEESKQLRALQIIAAGNTDPDRMVELAQEALKEVQ